MIPELILSTIIFAPGVILLALCAFVGFLMLIEKTGLFQSLTHSKWSPVRIAAVSAPIAAGSENPEPGPIVEGLKEAVAAEADEARKTG